MNANYIDAANVWFKDHLPELLKKYPGKWVVIFKGSLLGAFDDYSEAYRHGIESAKSEEIMIKEVREDADAPRDVSVNITLGIMGAANI